MARGIDQGGNVVGHRVAERQAQHLAAGGKHLVLRHVVSWRGLRMPLECLVARQVHDAPGGGAVWVVHQGVQHEAVQLRLGQGVSAFVLNRVLCGHHQKQPGQRVSGQADADLVLAHGLQQRGLHLGRGAVDFVGQHQVVKQRAALELEAAFFGAVDVGAGQVGGQHVGGELHTLEFTFQALRQRLDGARFGQAGWPFHQQVAVGQQGHQQALNQLVLAQDLGVEVVAQVRECRLGMASGGVKSMVVMSMSGLRSGQVGR